MIRSLPLLREFHFHAEMSIFCRTIFNNRLRFQRKLRRKSFRWRMEQDESARQSTETRRRLCRQAVGIYAVQFVAARFSLRKNLTATDLATLRFVGAGMVMLPVVGAAALSGVGLRRALTLAALAGLPYPIIINWGLTYAPAAHGAAYQRRSCSSFVPHIATTDKAAPATIGVAAIAGLILFIAPVEPTAA